MPNWITLYRAESFSEKEPETLAWIDNFDRDSVFWDIGANVGLYSIAAPYLRTDITAFIYEICYKMLQLDPVNLVVTETHGGVGGFTMELVKHLC